MRIAPLALALGLLGGCAPRISQASHYDRWAKQDTQRRAEEAEEAKKEAQAATGKAAPAKGAAPASGGGTAAPPPPPPPPPPPSYDGYNSLGGAPVKTATKAKAAQPAGEDDIY